MGPRKAGSLTPLPLNPGLVTSDILFEILSGWRFSIVLMAILLLSAVLDTHEYFLDFDEWAACVLVIDSVYGCRY